jgi:type I restriction enzyme S subunit
MKWKPYPAYKNSEIPWVLRVPQHWETRKLKQIASIIFSNVDKISVDGEQPIHLCNYIDVYKNDHIHPELDFMKASASPAEIIKFNLQKGDVLVTKDSEDWRDIAVPAYVVSDMDDVICGYHLARVRPDTAVAKGKYLFRAFSARGINDQFRVAATGITRYGLGKYWIDNSLFPLPPIEEQLAIADSLDRETKRIDSLIAKKERQIELLQEKRAALITHAVTKGLNPDAKLKDSGIEWLGEIPDHWIVRRLRHLILGGTRNGLYKSADHFTDDGVPMIQMGEAFSDQIIRCCANDRIQITESEKRIWGLREGDLLFARRSLVFEGSGKCSIVGRLPEVHVYESSLIRARPDKRQVLPRFLFLFLCSRFSRSQMLANARKVTISGIDSDQLKSLTVLVPPLEEQVFISQYIDSFSEKIDLLISRIHTSIERLIEYRSALISAGVTGQIDVRGEVA